MWSAKWRFGLNVSTANVDSVLAVNDELKSDRRSPEGALAAVHRSVHNGAMASFPGPETRVSKRLERNRQSDRIYNSLRDMAIRFQLGPGRRLTEVEIASWFTVSRTPVREALNRLVKEGFLIADGESRGFSVRKLEPKEFFDMYEFRLSLEVTSVRLAVERASEEQLTELAATARRFNAEPADCAIERIVELDELFHEQIALLSGNRELLAAIRQLNARIRYFRLVDNEQRPRSRSLGDHIVVAEALAERDASAAIQALETHVSRKMPEIVEVLRRCVAKISADHFDLHVADEKSIAR